MVKKSVVNKALSASHLQAIGKVAATWSTLELNILIALGDISGMGTFQIIKLVAPSGTPAWLDSLVKFVASSPKHREKLDSLNLIINEIGRLRTKRNEIVHAAWHQETLKGGLLGNSEYKIPVTTKSMASGLGIPKRGKEIIIDIKLSAADMRKVAREIEACTLTLFSWLTKPPPDTHRNMLAELLKVPPNRDQKKPSQSNPR